MARNYLSGTEQLAAGTITRALLNTATSGSAVIRRIIAGTGISISSTGADAGTGDVTINAGGTVTEYSNGSSGTSKTIDWSANGLRQKVTMTGNCTFTFTAPPTCSSIILKVIFSGGAYTITWPSSILWAGSIKPNISGLSASTNLVSLYYDGTYYYGSALGNCG